MSDVPDELKYTAEHEWVRAGDGSSTVRVGITDYAQQALGDVVYVSLPDVGASVDQGAAIGEVESTKSVSDLYAPLTGTVTARNEQLDDQPELINSDPYGDGLDPRDRRRRRPPSWTSCSTPAPTASWPADAVRGAERHRRGSTSRPSIDPPTAPVLGSAHRLPDPSPITPHRPPARSLHAVPAASVLDGGRYDLRGEVARSVLHRLWHREPARQPLLRQLRRRAARRGVRSGRHHDDQHRPAPLPDTDSRVLRPRRTRARSTR